MPRNKRVIIARSLVVIIAALIAFTPAESLTPRPMLKAIAAPAPDRPRYITEPGLAIIRKWEGYMPCRYKDAVGIWTIGYGHTKTVLQLPECIDNTLADKLIANDAQEAGQCVYKRTSYPIAQNHFNATGSLTFNVGCGNYAGSTMLRLINDGQLLAAGAQFPRWNKAGGQILGGLVSRRKDERALFEQGLNQ